MVCERCDELQETIRQLRDELNGSKVFPPSMQLTPTEMKVLRQFTRRVYVTRSLLSAALYSDRVSPPDDQIFQVIMHRVRQKISPLKIASVRGVGWTMDEETRAELISRMISP